jgi:hypothetical protein
VVTYASLVLELMAIVWGDPPIETFAVSKPEIGKGEPGLAVEVMVVMQLVPV